MEPVEQSHPDHKASVTIITQQVASYSLSPNKQSPAQGGQGQFTPTSETGVSLTTNVSAAAGGTDHELSEDEANSLHNNLIKDQDEFFNSFPPGYRFNPFDGELIVHYLMKKVLDQPLPPNRIFEVNLYRYNPEVLAEKYEKYGDKWYFFTPRDRKYRNGSRPKRAAGDGYWKATGADKEVKSSDGAVVGSRKALVFYRGKPPKGDKTNWIMHEFKVKDSPVRSRRGENDMRLDNWVLCRIYKKDGQNGKRCESRNHAEIHSPFPHRINDESMEIEMSGDIVDPLHEYDPALEYDHKYSYKAYPHMTPLPNISGGLPVNMISNNRIQSVEAASMNAGSYYANMGYSQPICVRPPSMSSESVLGPYRYIDESTILQDDMMFGMKGFEHSLYSTNNYAGQFSALDHVFPYTE
ncbi:NAC domain-containing protein 1-like [Malus sylvestris]|uniref:NAC domain-containing protein 1-like n=1 Tax=Malus domestica TaxID=3750 RepID=UPI0007EDF4E9|nr:NAC domain-containing protein 1-like [Malus domestica]XP_050141102.1 NAC domain-containing protein 1-like [Malus sylvestris]